MRILAIETSCDETCAAVTQGTNILSNIVWSQIDLHKEFGGVVPSIARRAHQEKIDKIINLAMTNVKSEPEDIDAVAVTVGPGLAIALEVGIAKAKELAAKWNKPLIAVNHVEGHVVSPLAKSISPPNPLLKSKSDDFALRVRGGNPEGEGDISFPCMALVVSGKHTDLILVKQIGDYQIWARTIDDALGEALDKAARMLGLGYPGGAELEKRASQGDPRVYPLPLPMHGRERRGEFSYSGLKTAFYRLVSAKGPVLSAQETSDLAASFQDRAFEHLIRVTQKTISNFKLQISNLLVGGGVAANMELRSRLSKLSEKVHFPPKGLYGDNAAMIGIAAGYKAQRGEFVKDINAIDRLPRWRIDDKAL